MNYFVTGIDTDSGKTLVSAILCEALQADYWKPIQAGLPKDSDTVRALISNTKTRFHPEKHLLSLPASPHASAKAENVTIQLQDFVTPTSENLIIEGAGGCLVPINQLNFVIDLAARLNATVIVVADLYLGSINHTLLTANLLKQRGLPVHGLIFNGESNLESEAIILKHTQYRKLLHVAREPHITKEVVLHYASLLKKSFHE